SFHTNSDEIRIAGHTFLIFNVFRGDCLQRGPTLKPTDQTTEPMPNRARNEIAEATRIKSPHGIHRSFSDFQSRALAATEPADGREVLREEGANVFLVVLSHVIGVFWLACHTLPVRRKDDQRAGL